MEEQYLWYFSPQFLTDVRAIKIVKECPRTFKVGNVVVSTIHKVPNAGANEYCGWDSCYHYYRTEEAARKIYNQRKEIEDRRKLQSSFDYIKEQASKETAKDILQEIYDNSCIIKDQYGNFHRKLDTDSFDKIAKKYGVKIDE